LFALAAACADPTADYEDYRARTDTLRSRRGGGGSGGATATTGCSTEAPRAVPGAAPAGDLSGVSLVTCLANVSACDVNKALRFKAEATQSGSALSLTFTPLAPGARTVAETQPGAASFVVAITLGADGSLSSQPFGDALVPGPSNTATGHALQLRGATLRGLQLTADLACAELDGDVTAEVGGVAQPISLDAPGDVCLFERVGAPTERREPARASFHCP